MNQEDEELLTVDRAAEILDVSHMTVRRYMNTGRLPKRRLGREYVLYPSDLKKLERPKAGRPRGSRNRPAPPAP